jgi:arylsulfatase
MRYSFDDAAAADRRETQYFEVFVNRGIYHQGWTAVTRHSTPWLIEDLPPIADDIWELYGPDDWTQAHDLAAQMPDKLEELQRLFMIEGTRYGVFPLDDRREQRFDAGIAGRPELIRGDSQLLYPGMKRLSEHSVINIRNKSHTVTAEVEIPDGGADGVVIAQGGQYAGWSVYLHEGRLAYCYNLAGLQLFKLYGDEAVPAGEHQVRMRFDYDGGGLGKGGDVSLYVDDERVGGGRVDSTLPMFFSLDETTDLGEDTASPVSDDYAPRSNRFGGSIHWVRIDTGAPTDTHDSIGPDDRLRIAMARQ